VAVGNPEGRPCLVFQQGETASFFFEYELLQDIEIPIGGIVIQNEKGIIVHGKNSLLYDSPVPSFVPRGGKIRFRQDIALELALGEYTFEVGFATIRQNDFTPYDIPYEELHARILSLCHVPGLGPFAVVPRSGAETIRLLHHGVANLPGNLRVAVVPPEPARENKGGAG
jgi:hypothetical protein